MKTCASDAGGPAYSAPKEPRADAAWAALFLASEESRWITGVVLPVDAGTTSSTALGVQMLEMRSTVPDGRRNS